MISRNGHGYKTTKRTVLVLPLKTGTYVIRALDAAGNKSAASTKITITRTGNANTRSPSTSPNGAHPSVRIGAHGPRSAAPSDRCGDRIDRRIGRAGSRLGASAQRGELTGDLDRG